MCNQLRRFLHVAALAALWPALLAAEPVYRIEVIDRYPPADTRLAPGQALYLRLAYRSEQALRVQLRGPETGRSQAMMNPAPAYPAGDGEALVWLAYRGPQEVSEVDILVFEENWTERARLTVPLPARWGDTGDPPRGEPGWVATLTERQQQMTRAAMQQGDDNAAGVHVAQFAVLAVPGYFLLQFLAWRRLSGAWRIAGLLPLLLSIPLLVYTLVALLAGSNLWPLMLILLSPLLFLYLGTVLILSAWSQRSG